MTCSTPTSSAWAVAAIVVATSSTRDRPRPERGRRSTARFEGGAGSARPGARCLQARLRRTDALRDRGGSLAPGRRELAGRHARHRDDEVEPVDQRPRQLIPVGHEGAGGTRALSEAIASYTTRAQVHRPDEQHAGRERGPTGSSNDGEAAVLQGLAKRLERRAHELGQFIDEQHPAMGQARFARTRTHAAADQRDHRRRVVGRSEWWTADQAGSGLQHSGDGVNAGHFQRLRVRQTGKKPREPTGKHGLPGTWRPGKQEVVIPRGGQLERRRPRSCPRTSARSG